MQLYTCKNTGLPLVQFKSSPSWQVQKKVWGCRLTVRIFFFFFSIACLPLDLECGSTPLVECICLLTQHSHVGWGTMFPQKVWPFWLPNSFMVLDSSGVDSFSKTVHCTKGAFTVAADMEPEVLSICRIGLSSH